MAVESSKHLFSFGVEEWKTTHNRDNALLHREQTVNLISAKNSTKPTLLTAASLSHLVLLQLELVVSGRNLAGGRWEESGLLPPSTALSGAANDRIQCVLVCCHYFPYINGGKLVANSRVASYDD